MAFNFTCPYCNTKTTINADNYSSSESKLYIDNTDGAKILDVNWIVCPNTDCHKLSLYTELFEHNYTPNVWRK